MTAELSSRIHTAAVTALAFVCTYVLAFYWNLDRHHRSLYAVHTFVS